MITLKRFLPDPRSFEVLARLRAPLTVSRHSNKIGGDTRLYLSAESGPPISLTVGYRDVVFKFEMFEIIVDTSFPTPISETIEIIQIREWDVITCLFRFEWERPAKPAEVPSHYVQIVGERGERDKIPSSALQAGVSMVGLAFGHADQRTTEHCHHDR